MQQAWKPGGEGTTRLFYVVAAEESSWRPLGFFGVFLRVGTSAVRAQWVDNWISPYRKVLGEKKREHKERGLPFSRLDHLGVLLCFVLSITSIDFPPRIFNKGKEALIFIFNQIR